MQIPTMLSGPTPRPCRRRATRATRRASSLFATRCSFTTSRRATWVCSLRTACDSAHAAFEAAGAAIGPVAEVWHADVLLKVNAPSTAEIDQLGAGTTLVGLLAPALSPDLVEEIERALK